MSQRWEDGTEYVEGSEIDEIYRNIRGTDDIEIDNLQTGYAEDSPVSSTHKSVIQQVGCCNHSNWKQCLRCRVQMISGLMEDEEGQSDEEEEDIWTQNNQQLVSE